MLFVFFFDFTALYKNCLYFNYSHPNSECPQCRKPISQNNIIQVYLDLEQSGLNEQIFLTRLSDINIKIESRDEKNEQLFMQLTDSLEKITMSISSFEYLNDMLRKENNEMKELIKGLQNENKQIASSHNESATMKEQIEEKDFMITNLQKEVNDLKSQRAETAREMKTIKEQINQLTAAAKGENKRGLFRDVNERGQSLTLKFDNFNDRV